MSEFGRQEAWGWPGRGGLARQGAALLIAVIVGLGCYARVVWWMTPLQRYYLPWYLKTAWLEFWTAKTGTYRLLDQVNVGTGQRVMARERDVVDGTTILDRNRRIGIQVSPDAREAGWRLAPVVIERSNATIREFLRKEIYGGVTLGGLALQGVLLGFVPFVPVVGLVAWDRRRRERRWRYGRRMRGPELVSTKRFNRKNRSDGIGFTNLERGLWDRVFAPERSRMVRVPRKLEWSHFLFASDIGMGKSTLTKEVLRQVEARGETAIVYDPHREYTPLFMDPERGDLVLNPLDARMPYWAPGEEVRSFPEALTVAASLFPDQHDGSNRFFVEAPRRLFAQLLLLKPTPNDLIHWMCHPAEIDRRIRNTHVEAFLSQGAMPQREGVRGSLNMVVDALKLLPSEEEAVGRWTALEWSRKRRGWLFLTSTPTTHLALLPLMSLWLDMLVLRLMECGADGGPQTWLVLDELASLRRLPQLKTAVTENRKSRNPIVLGFQGRSQLEAIYGRHDTDTILSQPATKIFMRTTEPEAAKWISDTIGMAEVERLRESRTDPRHPLEPASRSDALEHVEKPLVMASEIAGLPERHGYMKSGNFVVRLRFPVVSMPERQPALVPRDLEVSGVVASPTGKLVSGIEPRKPEPAVQSGVNDLEQLVSVGPEAGQDDDDDPFFE